MLSVDASPRPLRVWLPTIQSGSGTDVYTRRLADALTSLGHRATVSSFPHRLQYAPWLLQGVRPPADADVAVATCWNGYAFARTGLPVVVVMHHCVHDPAFRPYRNWAQAVFHRAVLLPAERASVRHAARVVAVSRHGATAAQRFLGAAEVEVIPNAVDTDFFSPAPQRPAYGGDRPIELLFVGNLSRRKGADLLPKIMARLGERAVLRYSEGLRADLRFRAAPNMQSLGTLSDEGLRDAYRRADLLLFPSRLEGFGYVAAEAMACGTPVVASRASALPEVVPDGRCGMLCPVDDVAAFASAILDLANSPERLQAMRVASRHHACESFGLAPWAKAMEALLHGVTAGWGRPLS